MTAEPQQTELLETETPAQEVAISDAELMEIAQKNPVVIFSGKHIDQFLKKFEADVKSVEHDVSTKKGREAMKSFIHQKLVKTRTAGVAAAETLAEQVKAEVKRCNTERDRFKNEMIRIEEIFNRISPALKRRLDMKVEADNNAAELETLRTEKATRDEADRIAKIAKDAADAATLKAETEAKIEIVWAQAHQDNAEFNAALSEKQKQEAEARAEQATWDNMFAEAERDNRDFDAEIKRKQDEAEQEELRSWNSMVRDAQRENDEFDDAVRLKEREELDQWNAMLSEALQENAAFNARKKAAQDIIDKAAQDAADAKKRAEDLAHTKKINSEIFADLSKAGGDEVFQDIATLYNRIIEAISKNQVRHTSITY